MRDAIDEAIRAALPQIALPPPALPTQPPDEAPATGCGYGDDKKEEADSTDDEAEVVEKEP